MIKMKNETMEYLKIINENTGDGDDFLSKFSDKDQVTILMNVKRLIAYAKSKENIDMSQACYKCKYRHDVPGDTHSCCSNRLAVAIGDEHGISHGWFFHPFNFDPVWLRYCDGFEEIEKKRN